jgi:hypothetical protein
MFCYWESTCHIAVPTEQILSNIKIYSPRFFPCNLQAIWRTPGQDSWQCRETLCILRTAAYRQTSLRKLAFPPAPPPPSQITDVHDDSCMSLENTGHFSNVSVWVTEIWLRNAGHGQERDGKLKRVSYLRGNVELLWRRHIVSCKCGLACCNMTTLHILRAASCWVAGANRILKSVWPFNSGAHPRGWADGLPTRNRNLKKHRFYKYYDIRSFTWLPLQPKSAPEIGWWPVHQDFAK